MQELRRRRDERHGQHRLRFTGYDDQRTRYPDGNYEYEAAHGPVTRHYYKYLEGEATSTNPMATIFAWSGALRKRGEKDGLKDLMNFGDQLEAACFDTLNSGIVTKDLVNLTEGIEAKAVNSAEFIKTIRTNLEKRLG